MKKFRYFLEYVFLSCVGYVARMLPRRLVLYIGARAGDFVFYCVPVRKKLTLEQLNRSFPEKSKLEISGIARGVYQNLGMNGLEHLCLPGLSQKELFDIVSFENEEAMDKALSRNKGVVLVGGHFGNWEYMGAALASKGYPIISIIANIENPYIDKMINEHRKKVGNKVLPKGMSVRGILSTLRKGEGVGILLDQDAGRSGILVDFFNKPCSTPKGPALLALKTGAAILFLSSIRQKDGSIKVVFEEIDIDYSKSASDENISEIMQKCTARLEYYTRKHPDHWFWMHRRWKTTPEQVGSQ